MYFLFIIIMFIAAFVTRGNAPVSCVCMVTASIFAIADSIMSLGDKVNKVNESIETMIAQYSDSRDEHAPLWNYKHI